MPVEMQSGVETAYMEMAYENQNEWVRYRTLPIAVKSSREQKKLGLVLYHAGKRYAKSEHLETLQQNGVGSFSDGNRQAGLDDALYFSDNKLCELLTETGKDAIQYILVYFNPSAERDTDERSYDPLHESLSMAYSVLGYTRKSYKFAGAFGNPDVFVSSDTIFDQDTISELFGVPVKASDAVDPEAAMNASDMFLVFEKVSNRAVQREQQKKLIERFLRRWQQHVSERKFTFLFFFIGRLFP